MEAPEYQSGFCTQFVTEKRHSIDNKAAAGGAGGGDHFMVEDLLDFSNDDDAVIADTPFEAATTTTAAGGNSTDSSTVTVVDSCNSSSFSGCDPNFVSDIGCRNFPDANFSSDLCVPYDDLAELEWLSNFVEESFSSEDLQKLQMISGMKARTVDETSETTPQHEPSNRNSNSPIFRPEMSVPAKARSKRSRAAPCNWTSRLLVLSQQSPSSSPSPPPPQQLSLPPWDQDIAVAKKTVKVAAYSKKKDGVDSGGDGRKCLHCATDKTPQWRTGPMGPKTLCNACGVRYKSGRLVPEYRPAASPTFMLTKHSNSHRKVLELRRQKEMMRTHHHHHHHHHQQHQHHQHQHQQQQFLHHHHQNMVFDVTNGGDDYLIHSHVGPDFRQLI